MICEEISKNFQESERDCLKGQFTFSKKAITQQIAGETVVVQFFADATFAGKTYSVVVNAKLGVDGNGNIVRQGWIVESVSKAGLTNEALLQETSTSDENAESIPYKKLSPVIQQAFDEFQDSERDFFNEASDWEDGDREYYVVKNNDGKVIGYLVSDSWMSESLDVKIFFTLKFNVSGEFLDSSSESFGYYE